MFKDYVAVNVLVLLSSLHVFAGEYDCTSAQDQSKTAVIRFDEKDPTKISFSAPWLKRGKIFNGTANDGIGEDTTQFKMNNFSNNELDEMTIAVDMDLFKGFPASANLIAIDNDGFQNEKFDCRNKGAAAIPPIVRPSLTGFPRILINPPYEKDPNLLSQIGRTVVFDVAGILSEPIEGLYPQDVMLMTDLDKEVQTKIEGIVKLSLSDEAKQKGLEKIQDENGKIPESMQKLAKQIMDDGVEYSFWQIELSDGSVIYTQPQTNYSPYGVKADAALANKLESLRKDKPGLSATAISLFHTHPGSGPLSEDGGDIDNSWNRVYKYKTTVRVYAVSIRASKKGRILFHYINTPQ